MSNYNVRILAGLAMLALAFTGAEAVVCSANHYLEMDGAYTSSVANAPKCTPCPGDMTAPAGVAGGYGDSAAPRYAAAVAVAAAATTANNNLLTWCNVPEGSYLSAQATATSPGAATACGSSYTATTSAATTISGPLAAQTALVQCVTKSSCAANKYLESNGAYTASTPNALVCTACPGDMTAPAGTTLSNVAALAAKTAVAAAAADTNLITWCNVPAGSYLSTLASATSPGAATACGYTTTTSPETLITGALGAQTKGAQCSLVSSCAANKYLESNGAYDAGSSTPNALVCTACPAGMTAPAGTTLSSAHATIAAAAIADTAADTNLVTFCNVPAGSYLSTQASATTPGAVSSCGDVYTTTTSPETLITGALGAQTAIAQCTKISRCAANEYLESDGSYQASATGLPAVTNKLVCTPCPTGMTALAGASYGTLTVAPTSAAASQIDVNLATFCNVPNNYWLSTAVTATTPGAVTACGAAFSPSHGTFITGATNVEVELAKCGVTAVPGAAGAAGPTGPAGPAVSPASPLSSVTTMVIAMVLPALVSFA